MSANNHPKVGSIWAEDYRYGTGYVRYVRVVGVADDGRVIIEATDSGRRSKAKAERFGKKGGYFPATSELPR